MKSYTREECQAKRLDHVPLKNCRFHIGDKVRIIKPGGVVNTQPGDENDPGSFYRDDAGHMQTWVEAMDELVGKEITLRFKITNGWLCFKDEDKFNAMQAALGTEIAQMLCLSSDNGFALTEDWMELVEAVEIPELDAYYHQGKGLYVLTDGARWYGARLSILEDVDETEALVQDFNLECAARQEQCGGDILTREYLDKELAAVGLRLQDMQRATPEQLLQVAQTQDTTIH